MRLAAIDLGSNSLHMVVVEVGRGGGFRVIGREKEMVRLGEGTLARGRLSAPAVERALFTLRKYQCLIESQRVDKTLAVATAAVREASNGEAFLERVGRELGIWPRAISGEEEARLIYLAALHSIHLEGKRALVVDIGGGSLELAFGAGRDLRWAVSERLGVLRLAEGFVGSDPLSAGDERRLVRHVEQKLEPHLERLQAEGGFDCLVGTSGTIMALGALALETAGANPAALHHAAVPAESLQSVRRHLVGTSLRARREHAALAGRADTIVIGSVVLGALLRRLQARELLLCEWALREGLLLDYIQRHARSVARAEAYPDVRLRSVVALAERCQYDGAHARQVAGLSLSLFDQTRRRHGLGPRERSLLEYAALLHDVGHHISYPGHHKHTYYLIKNGDLRGFQPLELEILANVARYHRRGRPRKKHAALAALPRAARQTVKVLAAHLRLADALDRSHRQVVRGVTVSERSGHWRVACHVDGDCELELWGGEGRKGLLEEVLDAPVQVLASRGAPASAAPRLSAETV